MWHQKHRAHRLLRRLDVALPVPLTVSALVSALEEKRGRPIHLVAMTVDEPTGPCGLWVATAEADYVLFDRDSPPVLQVQTTLHELMHIALKHIGTTVVDGAAQPIERGDADPVETVLARSSASFDQQQEMDAELLATYLGARLDRVEEVGAFEDLHEDTAAVMYRIAAALTH
ncbi:hypothetical protein O3597_26405 [Verrucosispora sp. WMMA2044]|uniref:ImmA/IrrE family metallo-endopeptidase n=1 Tax=Verrucosispora sioxanthis TaxID=2499994 RepID=A0A6M1LC79_9ACTN|nr:MULTISPECIES: hypothetical protein [Micromonospora]NEE66699.1 hypothetical protein [Verrucosispora sioxanthis]NGM15809.1 hypothetical protein [Verrucosispora sioxanthis]WBB48570.1 hypothetical protein O3597_26405 [Verrucosispora sp. WMMA2044]